MTKHNINWQLLDRYLAGEASHLERQLVERWLVDNPDARLFLAELNRSDLTDETVRQAKADVWARLQDDMAAPHEPAMRPAPPPRRQPLASPAGVHPPSRRTLGTLKAAAVALVLGGSLLVWQATRSPEEPGRGTDAMLGTVAVPAGRSPVSTTLPDGSQAIVSPGSTLRYTAAFGAERREVQLEGEAYFSVRHDAARPFIVHAGDLAAEDLGTEFVVRAYPEDRHGRVVVREGLVGIAGATVEPGQLGRLSADGTPIVEPAGADTVTWFAWTRGALHFAGMPLRDALPKLSRWYDVEFRLAAPSLGDIHLVGPFPPALDDKALGVVGLSLGLHLTRQGRVIRVRAADPS